MNLPSYCGLEDGKTTQDFNKTLCEVAEAYVLEEYARVGDRVYVWEEWDNPADDTTAHLCTGFCPPSDYDGYYQWGEVYSCEVIKSEVVEQNQDSFTVRVCALIALIHSFDENEEVLPEEREIFCSVEYDEDENEYYVENAEE